MRTGLFVLLISGSLIMQPALAGTNLTIPGNVPTEEKQPMPKRGISMEAVLGEFGEPDQRMGPVGDPPITEWDYGTFRVYFEHQTVLHSVDLTTIVMPN